MMNNTAKIEMLDISEIKTNSNNPRSISKLMFSKLKKSLQEFPEMLNKRPLVIDEDNIVLGGNMRLAVLKDLNYKQIPVMRANGWTEKQKKEFIVKDNVAFGEWDWDILANEWEIEQLDQWGLPLPMTKDEMTEMANPDNAETAHPFATEIDRQKNYLVLKFENDIDWIQAKTLFGLQTETAKRSNGKPWSSGIGRVLDGVETIKKLTNAS